jgi:hypothetical protein
MVHVCEHTTRDYGNEFSQPPYFSFTKRGQKLADMPIERVFAFGYAA